MLRRWRRPVALVVPARPPHLRADLFELHLRRRHTMLAELNAAVAAGERARSASEPARREVAAMVDLATHSHDTDRRTAALRVLQAIDDMIVSAPYSLRQLQLTGG